MGPLALPLELLLLIVGRLQPRSIANLTAVNRVAHRSLVAALYSNITVTHRFTVKAFARTIGQKLYHDLVVRLQIGGYPVPENHSYEYGTRWGWQALSQAVCSLENLKDLTIVPELDVSKWFYQQPKYAFRLNHFACNCYAEELVVTFLTRQSSITHLDVGYPAPIPWSKQKHRTYSYRDLCLRDSILPHLTSVVGPPAALCALCPGRPIQRVHIIVERRIDGGLANNIAKSTAPIRFLEIEIDGWEPGWYGLAGFFEQLKRLPTFCTLQELKITVNTNFTLQAEPSWIDGLVGLESLEVQGCNADLENHKSTRLEVGTSLKRVVVNGRTHLYE